MRDWQERRNTTKVSVAMAVSRPVALRNFMDEETYEIPAGIPPGRV
jgi:hypothetical protein